MFYLSDVTNSIPHVLKLFEEFGSFSGYNINWSESILMQLNAAAKTLPITLQITGFTYLGINIKPSLSLTVNDNYNVTLAKIGNYLDKWSPLHVTLQGLISIVKMGILPLFRQFY